MCKEVPVLPVYSSLSARFAPFCTVLSRFILPGSFLFLPKNGGFPLINVQKDKNVRNVRKVTESGETPVKPVGRREENVEDSHRFEQKRAEMSRKSLPVPKAKQV